MQNKIHPAVLIGLGVLLGIGICYALQEKQPAEKSMMAKFAESKLAPALIQAGATILSGYLQGGQPVVVFYNT